MPFSHFGLHDEILRSIHRSGYRQPTPIQLQAVPVIMQGKDVIAIAQTGTGKTAAFLWPLLQHRSLQPSIKGSLGTHTLILVPTRELAVQISENIRAYAGKLPLRVVTLYGGIDEQAQHRQLRQGADFVVATPGRLIDWLERKKITFPALNSLVLDEADRMLHMGFLPSITAIIEQLPHRRQTLMFSATFSKEIEALARRFQHRPQMIQIGEISNPADTIAQSVYEVPMHLKGDLLLALLKQAEMKKVLVFARMKDGADRITVMLQQAQVAVVKLHSSRSQEQRLQALEDFKTGKAQVLVATDILARGIDIDGVTHVINYDFPVNPEDYIHRIGRTGRADAVGQALSFVPKEDLNLLNILELFIGQRLPRKRLKNFDYHAAPLKGLAGMVVARRDWRKRTREMEAKRQGVEKKSNRAETSKKTSAATKKPANGKKPATTRGPAATAHKPSRPKSAGGRPSPLAGKRRSPGRDSR